MEPKIRTEQIETVSITELKEHPRNPNRNELYPIVDSIEKVGFYGAIQAQRSTGYIITGNHRYRAAIAAGLTEVPVIYLDIQDDEAYRIMLSDNKIAEAGRQDQDQVDKLLASWNDEISYATIHNQIQNGPTAAAAQGNYEINDDDERYNNGHYQKEEKPDRSRDPETARRIISLAYTNNEHKIAMAGISVVRERYEAVSNAEAVAMHLREVLQ